MKWVMREDIVQSQNTIGFKGVNIGDVNLIKYIDNWYRCFNEIILINL